MSKPLTHTVVAGDTLSALAKKYGTTVKELKDINGLKSDLIKVGQVLDLIKTEHKVVSGDTLSALAKKYKTTVDILKSINGLKSDLIKVGQTLKLRDVIELYWSYGDEQTQIVNDVFLDYADLNLHIVTRGYQVGDRVEAVVDYETESGIEKLSVYADVDSNGIAVAKKVFHGLENILIYQGVENG